MFDKKVVNFIQMHPKDENPKQTMGTIIACDDLNEAYRRLEIMIRQDIYGSFESNITQYEETTEIENDIIKITIKVEVTSGGECECCGHPIEPEIEKIKFIFKFKIAPVQTSILSSFRFNFYRDYDYV